MKGPREKENFSLCIVPNLPAALGPLAPPFWGSCRSSGAGPFCKLLRAPQRQAVAALLADLTRLREGMAGLQPAELLNSVLDAAGLYERARQRRERRRGQGLEEDSDEGGSDSGDSDDDEAGKAGEQGAPPSQQQQQDDSDAAQQEGSAARQAELLQQGGAQPAPVTAGQAAAPGGGDPAGCEAEKGPYRMRLSGPLGVLQREAAAFPAGAWQLRVDDYREALAAALQAAQGAAGRPAAGADPPASAALAGVAAADGAAAGAAPGQAGGGADQRDGALLPLAGGAPLAELQAALECRGPLPLQEFLAYMVADADNGASPLDDGVRISTIHSAKGLEWDIVFSPRWHEGFLPREPPSDDEGSEDEGEGELRPLRPLCLGSVVLPEVDALQEELEEGRRLAHVAATRARLEHHISYPSCFPPSRCLGDVQACRGQPGLLQEVLR